MGGTNLVSVVRIFSVVFYLLGEGDWRFTNRYIGKRLNIGRRNIFKLNDKTDRTKKIKNSILAMPATDTKIVVNPIMA